MSNENFPIPGLQQPEPVNHLTRSKTVVAGGFLPLMQWMRGDRTPSVALYHAARPGRPHYVLDSRKISVSVHCGQKRIGIWLPDDIAEGDWMAEGSVNGGTTSRTLFSVGRAATWEVPVTGRVMDLCEAGDTGKMVETSTDTIWIGSSWGRRLTISDLNGVPTDLTDYSVWSQLRTEPGGTLLATITCTVVSPATSGLLDLTLSATITGCLKTRWAWWDVLLQRPDLTYDRTLPIRVFIGTGVTENG